MNNTDQSPTRLEVAPSADGATSDTGNPLPLNELFSGSRAWPEEILVEPHRLESTSWGEKEGDICAAYCADTFPKIKTFRHEGQLYTNCGGTPNSVSGYPLQLPHEYKGTGKQPYSYEGEQVRYENQLFTLGPKIAFTIRQRTLAEEVALLRRIYAHGGYFASGKSYREVLLQFLDRSNISQGDKTAIESELAKEILPETQAEMLRQLGKSDGSSKSDDNKQIALQSTLPGF